MCDLELSITCSRVLDSHTHQRHINQKTHFEKKKPRFFYEIPFDFVRILDVNGINNFIFYSIADAK